MITATVPRSRAIIDLTAKFKALIAARTTRARNLYARFEIARKMEATRRVK